MASWMNSSTMTLYATFDSIGVREIGWRSLLSALTVFSFGTGTLSALFHDGGRQPSQKEQLRISVMGSARQYAFSFSNQAGTPSGP